MDFINIKHNGGDKSLKAAYCDAISSIDYSRIKVLQFGGLKGTRISSMKCVDTMSKLRSNPFDMNAPEHIPEASYCDMVILWTGAYGFPIISANDKRYPALGSSDYNDDVIVLNKLKTDSFILQFLENRPTAKKFLLQNGAIAYMWEKPYRLRAMTYYDMHYGDRWYWSSGNLQYVEEGNKYGDTSDFIMFGKIEDRLNRFRKQLKC